MLILYHDLSDLYSRAFTDWTLILSGSFHIFRKFVGLTKDGLSFSILYKQPAAQAFPARQTQQFSWFSVGAGSLLPRYFSAFHPVTSSNTGHDSAA